MTELTVGVYQYEHTAALLDGTVTIEDVDATFETAPLVSDLFQRMVRGDFDVAELGLTYLLRLFDLDDPPFLALPIFPNRNFRHSAIFVNTSSGIEGPQDLAGRAIGEFALYGHDAGIWPKGILADEYGVTPDQCRWVVGGTNHPLPSFDWIPQPVPPGVDIRHTTDGETLGALLESGEIDALISVDVPQALLDGSPKVARLFPDYPTVERAYYRRTGIFPMMHTIAVRKELAARPDLLTAVYRAFDEAKEITVRRYREGAVKQHMAIMTPWFSELFAENQRLLGDDWWPYGVKANRAAVDTFLRYHHEQGLSQRLLTCEDIFVPALLDT
ncbi:substrate-binding domain-containing protein [Lentzea nigeriaca]|uniref:4,5-dihydroxyphthalate decarboxylase n=1 Tax=Lentzea nigeriaca TaxID=1128665 RepID=UPI00195718B6|nr:4,5-dihydroxyphthalate decarboxylase [Lentzea nigeriaca]MBM7856475.1 4,5-dihydroxyphthalate decarboxylase [Lentzea nigeriaca]